MVPVSIHSKSMFKYLVLYLQTRVLHLPWKYWVKMLRENLGKWGGFPHRGFTEEMASAAAAAAAKSLQSCLTLCHPIDGSPPDSPVPGILQARTQEWVAISFSNAWKWKVKVKSFSRVRPSATPWTAAFQAPPSMGYSRSGVLEWGAIIFSEQLF